MTLRPWRLDKILYRRRRVNTSATQKDCCHSSGHQERLPCELRDLSANRLMHPDCMTCELDSGHRSILEINLFVNKDHSI